MFNIPNDRKIEIYDRFIDHIFWTTNDDKKKINYIDNCLLGKRGPMELYEFLEQEEKKYLRIKKLEKLL